MKPKRASVRPKPKFKVGQVVMVKEEGQPVLIDSEAMTQPTDPRILEFVESLEKLGVAFHCSDCRRIAIEQFTAFIAVERERWNIEALDWLSKKAKTSERYATAYQKFGEYVFALAMVTKGAERG